MTLVNMILSYLIIKDCHIAHVIGMICNSITWADFKCFVYFIFFHGILEFAFLIYMLKGCQTLNMNSFHNV